MQLPSLLLRHITNYSDVYEKFLESKVAVP
jgi:hypothetical protein